MKPKDINNAIGKISWFKTIYHWIKKLNVGLFFQVKFAGRPITSSKSNNIRKIKRYLNKNKRVV